MCRFLGEAERSFFAWFVNENHGVASVRAQLRASLGMCPAHSRRLVEDPGPGPVLTTVALEAVAGARARLSEDSPGGPCPACAALARSCDDAARLLIDGLARDNDRRRYAHHRGICLDHLVGLAATAPPAIVSIVGARLEQSLAQTDGPAHLTVVAHNDHDARRRARWRAALPEASVGPSGSTIAELSRVLRQDTCPICLAGGLAERRYLRWRAQATAAGDSSLSTDPWELCGTHLQDLALTDAPAAGQAIDAKRLATQRALGRVREAVPSLPRPGRRRRGDPAAAEEIQRLLGPLHPCPACRARATAEQRQAQLLDAAMALPQIRATYETGHGVCMRHLSPAADGGAAQVMRRVADARLAVLHWELDEIRRKYAWDARHEPPGPEQHAWLRGLAQLDGRVLMGGPAPASGTPHQGMAPSSAETARPASTT